MSSSTIKDCLNLVLQTSMEHVVLLDQNLKIIDANTNFNRLFDIAPTSLEAFITRINSETTQIEKKIVKCFSQPETPFRFSSSFLNKKKVQTWVEWTAKTDGQYCVLIGSDATKYQRTVKALNTHRKQVETQKKTEDLFVAKMNHELRTPLNAIIGYSQILLRSQLPEDGKDYAQRIRQNGKKLLHQIDNVLSFSDTEPVVNIEKVDLFQLLRVVIDEFELTLDNHDRLIELKDIRHQDAIDADYDRLYHVVRNLLDNAIKFSENGNIELVVESDKYTPVALHIVDQGVGVCNENVDSIFAPFQKGMLLLNDCGVGLGLSVAKKLCKEMGFKLNLQPTEIGSKFTISFRLDQ